MKGARLPMKKRKRQAGEKRRKKLAFEVAVRINRVTPVTVSSLVTLALLGHGDRALTVGETQHSVRDLLQYVRMREISLCSDVDLGHTDGVRRALDALAENGVVSRFSGGVETVYRIGPEKQLTAAYYRNTVIHFFVNASIVELALLKVAEAPAGDPLAAFWDEAMRLRDLLKFEFFFSEKERFRSELAREVALHDASWEACVRRGPAAIKELVRGLRPFFAHLALRPFLEAYRLVGDYYERSDPTAPHAPARTVDACMGLGRQYDLQRRIQSAASVSRVLIETALRLAGNRGLLEPGPADLAERRRAFAEEIRDVIRRIDVIDALAASRRAGLID